MTNTQPNNFRVVRAKRLYELVAEQIEELIREKHLVAGARLPAERELSEMLGVSRPSLREAMIALETLGLVEVRVGGGTFVTDKPGGRGAVSFIGDADLGPGPLEQFEARQAVEVACARYAALRATPDQLAAMEGMVKELGDLIASGINPMDLHRSFHEALAEASGNLIFVKAVTELWQLRQQKMWNLLRTKVENSDSWRLGLEMRRQLLRHLVAREAEEAAQVLADHFERLGRLYFGSAAP